MLNRIQQAQSIVVGNNVNGYNENKRRPII